MNQTSTKMALGVNPQRSYSAVNWNLNREMSATGEGMANTASLVPELINDGVRLLVYAGDADGLVTNYIGKECWVEALENQFHGEFLAAKSLPWVDSVTGRVAGEVRSAGGDGLTAGNVTFVRVYEAGHLVPHDQPEAALDLITRWTKNIPLSNT
ncbi:carboxypeptidase y [Moniliophthora roreri]|nr:carboxypeptidase y [Moniliophthora roreri]